MTIILKNLTKRFRLRGSNAKFVARDVNLVLEPGQSVAILGKNGAGKSTLLSMVSGKSLPDKGEVITKGSLSWPVGFAGSFHPDLTGAQNAVFLARLYGVDSTEMLHYVESFAELGDHFRERVMTYSSGMRSRLAFGCSMAIKFDWYLVDEVTSVGDASFKEKSMGVFRDRMKTSSALFVSHSLTTVQRVCDTAILIENGTFTYFDKVRDGVSAYTEIVNAQQRARQEAARNNPVEIKRRKRELRLERKAAERQEATLTAQVASSPSAK
jgi:capsular polysaccharide transport system ATP-binding protein